MRLFRLFLNSAIFNSWFNAGISTLNAVIVFPTVLTKLEVPEVNLWFLIATVVTISQAVQFGFNTTFSRFISYVHGGVRIEELRNLKSKSVINFKSKIDTEELSEVYNLMRKVYLWLSILYFFVILMISYLALRSSIENLTKPSIGWIAVGIVIINTTIILYYGFYQNFMIGINKVNVVQRVTGLVNLFGLGLILLVIIQIPSLLSLIVVYQIISTITLIFIIIQSRKNFRILELTEKRKPFNKELFSIVWDNAWKSGTSTVLANIIKHISSLLVAQFFSTAQSASFLFTKRIFDIIEKFTMTTFNSRLPVIAKLRGQGNLNKLIPFLKQTITYSYIVFLIGYISLLVIGDYALLLLNSKILLGSKSLIILFSFGTLLSRWGGITQQISNQSNHVLEHVNIIFISIIYFTVIILGINWSSLNIFPLAQIISSIIVTPIISIWIYKTLQTKFWNFEKVLIIPVLIILFFINGIYYFVL